MEEKKLIIEALNYLEPSNLDYTEWIKVGQSLKSEGFSVDVWDEWSKYDPRYVPGECEKKWSGFSGSGVTGGTIIHFAKCQGFSTNEGHVLDWDDYITIDSKMDYRIIDTDYIEGLEIEEPVKWEPINELITYLEAVFQPDDIIGYCAESYKNEKDKWVPSKGGVYSRTAGEMIAALKKCGGDITDAIGSYNQEAGVWIRVNGLDGKGCKNENVVDFRHVLVESDSIDIDKQNQIMRELELPITALVSSGGKSLHAIVKIQADTYDEYRKRVNFLYEVCSKNGLKIDTQNRNPSRLSRMPGVIRENKKQFLIATNIGQKSWNEWFDWFQESNDDLPDPESLYDVWDNMPSLSPELIQGILRQGHKMLISGKSKAGKSFALIELCIAIAENGNWFGHKCTKGKVMYVNLELDKASCLHRFKDVYTELEIKPDNINNIDIWHLRGNTVPMDQLAPKLIRRAKKKGYIAIVIDPIYKVITGDENSASDMAKFVGQFDRICNELNTAVIICHHHSKGSQGAKKSTDRASGSGVFARDPDAILDMIELEITEGIKKVQEDELFCKIVNEFLIQDGYGNEPSQDDLCSVYRMNCIALGHLKGDRIKEMNDYFEMERKKIDNYSGWRVEATLREFPTPKPIELFFKYPIHEVDKTGMLSDIKPEGTTGHPKKKKEEDWTSGKKKKEIDIANAYEFLLTGSDTVSIQDIANYYSVSAKTIERRIKETEGFKIFNKKIMKEE